MGSHRTLGGNIIRECYFFRISIDMEARSRGAAFKKERRKKVLNSEGELDLIFANV